MTRVNSHCNPGCTNCAAWSRSAAWLVLLAAAWLAGAAAARSDEAEPAVEHAGTRHALILCGLPGDDDHRTLLAGAAGKIAQALTERCGFQAADVWLRFGEEAPSAEAEGFGPVSNRGPSDRAALEADVVALRRLLKPEDGLWVIVLGHGHFDGRSAHLNLPGPDIDERGFGKLFAGIAAREQVFFLTTSASGYLLGPLSAPGRVVITATEPDRELNETLFPLALADVLAAPPPEADRDRDGKLSVFELYLAVVTDVLQRYLTAEEIATEHARLDDNGDGRGTEVQLRFLPPELLEPGRKIENPKEKSRARKAKPEETLRPQDDGARAAAIRVDRPAPSGAIPEAVRAGPGSPR